MPSWQDTKDVGYELWQGTERLGQEIEINYPLLRDWNQRKFLGKQFRELGKTGSGVFRSNDNLRQFRMDVSSLNGNHKSYKLQIHLELFDHKDEVSVINHIIIGG